LRIPLEKLDIRDEDAMSVAVCEEVVGIWHVNYRAAFDTVLVAHIESDVVLDVKFPKSFVFLQREAEQITKCESVLVVCVDEEVGVDDAGGRILDDCVRGGVVHTRPV
jgi:hypothetical protein